MKRLKNSYSVASPWSTAVPFRPRKVLKALLAYAPLWSRAIAARCSKDSGNSYPSMFRVKPCWTRRNDEKNRRRDQFARRLLAFVLGPARDRGASGTRASPDRHGSAAQSYFRNARERGRAGWLQDRRADRVPARFNTDVAMAKTIGIATLSLADYLATL